MQRNVPRPFLYYCGGALFYIVAQCGEGDWELELELWRGEFDSAGAAL